MRASELSRKVADLLIAHIGALEQMIDLWPDGEVRKALEQARALMDRKLVEVEKELAAALKAEGS